MVHLRFDQVSTASRHHTSFPAAIEHMLAAVPVERLDLSLARGRWDFDSWGWPAVPVRTPGAELHASFNSSLAQRPDALAGPWAHLAHALAGLSCASLNLLASADNMAEWAEHFTAPAPAAEPTEGLRHLRAWLPREAVCTENLTPWLLLLPCRDQAGLAALLKHRPTVFGAGYQALGLTVERTSTPEGHSALRLVQTITLVLQPDAATVATAAAGKPLLLKSLLNAEVPYVCPIAARSNLYLASYDPRATASLVQSARDLSMPLGFAALWPRPAGSPSLYTSTGQLAKQCSPLEHSGASPLLYYDLLELSADGRPTYNLHMLPQGAPPSSPDANGGAALVQQEPTEESCRSQPQLTTQRYITGSGLLHGRAMLVVQRSGALRLRLAASNCTYSGPSSRADGAAGWRAQVEPSACMVHMLCMAQVVPWYVKPWVHTLQLALDGKVVPLGAHLASWRIQPAVDRQSPGLLDICLHLPPTMASLRLSMDFSKAFLTAFEYPPDAHRGFDVPPAVVMYLDPAYGAPLEWATEDTAAPAVDTPLLLALAGDVVQQVYTPGLLVPLAAPDFSMPYNVICLTSTLLAIYFGVMLNIIVHRPEDEAAVSAKAGDARGRTLRIKLLKVAVLLVAVGTLALYIDAELREQAKDVAAGVAAALRHCTDGLIHALRHTLAQ